MKKATKKRNINGDGTIFQLPNGKWRCEVTVGWTATGKRIRRSRTRAKRSDCAAEKRKLQNEADRGLVDSSNLTVAQFLERWIADIVKPKRAPNTYVSYSRQVVNHIIPRLGTVKLSKLSPMHVERFTASMAEDAVGRCTQRYAFRILHNALRHAMKHGMLLSNPCTIAETPTHKRADIFPFTREEAMRLLEETAGTPYEGLYVMGFTTGMRPSEMYGLHWSDVDFDQETIHVRLQLCRAPGHPVEFRTPKTPASIRTIKMSQRLSNVLHERRKIQMAEGNGKSPLVFCARQGKPLWNNRFCNKQWYPLLDEIGLKKRGLHHMRHTYATLQLRAGVPVHLVSSVLGHSKPSITWDTYCHLLPGDEHAATISIQELIG